MKKSKELMADPRFAPAYSRCAVTPWRSTARRVIRACFDWSTTVADQVRVTAAGATAGFGATEREATKAAVDATLREIEWRVVRRGMPTEQRLEAVRRCAIFDVHRWAS